MKGMKASLLSGLIFSCAFLAMNILYMWSQRVFGLAQLNSSVLMDVLIFGVFIGLNFTVGSTLGYVIVTFVFLLRGDEIPFKKQLRYAVVAAALAYASFPTGRWAALKGYLEGVGIVKSGEADSLALVIPWAIVGVVSGLLVWTGVRAIGPLLTHLKARAG